MKEKEEEEEIMEEENGIWWGLDWVIWLLFPNMYS
jgi:hypothetical protein